MLSAYNAVIEHWVHSVARSASTPRLTAHHQEKWTVQQHVDLVIGSGTEDTAAFTRCEFAYVLARLHLGNYSAREYNRYRVPDLLRGSAHKVGAPRVGREAPDRRAAQGRRDAQEAEEGTCRPPARGAGLHLASAAGGAVGAGGLAPRCTKCDGLPGLLRRRLWLGDRTDRVLGPHYVHAGAATSSVHGG